MANKAGGRTSFVPKSKEKKRILLEEISRRSGNAFCSFCSKSKEFQFVLSSLLADTFTFVEVLWKDDGIGLLSSVSGRWCPQDVLCGVDLPRSSCYTTESI